ncbi:hypothetical protein AB0D86_35795 [Streptomyces sp. NPDC048324]
MRAAGLAQRVTAAAHAEGAREGSALTGADFSATAGARQALR